MEENDDKEIIEDNNFVGQSESESISVEGSDEDYDDGEEIAVKRVSQKRNRIVGEDDEEDTKQKKIKSVVHSYSDSLKWLMLTVGGCVIH